MGYGLLDDGFHDHPKVVALLDEEQGLAALGLWTLTLVWARKQARPDRQSATDGLLPVGLVRRMGGTPELTRLLEAAPPGYQHGLWDRDAGTWRIHDFAYWQQLDQWRARSAAGKRAAASRWGGPALFDANGNATADADAHATADAIAIPTSVHLNTPIKHLPIALARFDDFWTAYPRKVGKGQARKAWAKAITIATPDRIIAAAEAYRDKPGRDPKFTAHPTTWLNGERWTDEDDDTIATPAVQEVSPYQDWDDGTSGWGKGGGPTGGDFG